MPTKQWRLGVVTGLRAEARIAGPLGMVAAGGGMPGGARAAAERLVAEGATALLSFGLCGGLDPALSAGTLIVPLFVREGPATDAELTAALGGATTDAICAGTAIIATAAAKEAVFTTTGAAGVDLESGPVAAVAARHGIPFAVLRAVCDPATFDLPPAALIALDAQGGIDIWRVAASVFGRPGQLPALLTLARAAAKARAALVRRVGEIVHRR
jgi:adenosylhomocysteine nucleosidase